MFSIISLHYEVTITVVETISHATMWLPLPASLASKAEASMDALRFDYFFIESVRGINMLL